MPAAHLDHGIRPLLIFHVGKLDDVGAVGEEHAAEEGVDEVHLPDDVGKVEEVAEEILKEKLDSEIHFMNCSIIKCLKP